MWMQRFLDAIDRAYERRLRRASGLDAPAQRVSAHVSPAQPELDDGAEIVNVSLGTVLPAPERGPLAPDATPEHASAASAPSALPPTPELEPPARTAAPRHSAAEAEAAEGAISNIAPGSSAEAGEGEAEGEIVNLPPGGTEL